MAQMRQRRVSQKIAIEKELLVRFGRVKDRLEGDSALSMHTKKREERRRTEGARKKTKLRVQQVQQSLKSANCNCEPTTKRMRLQFGGQGGHRGYSKCVKRRGKRITGRGDMGGANAKNSAGWTDGNK